MYYLVVHTGSRNLGKQVAQIYQKLAVKCQSGWAELMEAQERMIVEYKAARRNAELQEAIRQLHCSFKTRRPAVPQELSYLEGRYRYASFTARSRRGGRPFRRSCLISKDATATTILTTCACANAGLKSTAAPSRGSSLTGLPNRATPTRRRAVKSRSRAFTTTSARTTSSARAQ